MAISELAIFKPTLKLDDATQIAWAQELARTYPAAAVLMAINQIKHSEAEWVNFGIIATEARRVAAKTDTRYRPHADPRRLTVTQLQQATFDGSSAAANLLKQGQIEDLARRQKRLTE